MSIKDWGPGHHYPTVKGQRRLRAKDFDPNSSITDYVYNELQSKPWTRDMFVREHPEPAAWVFDSSIIRGEISPSPMNWVRNAQEVEESVIDLMGHEWPDEYEASRVMLDQEPQTVDPFDEKYVCDICGKYTWEGGHNH